jgi:radical SAM protein with 4Fe4S-binding SPASM domain
MVYYLSDKCELKLLEFPAVYNILSDELYELDEQAFDLLKNCISEKGCHIENKDFLEYCLLEEIIVSNPTNVRRAEIAKSPIPSLRYLELQITDKCNLRCKHCYLGKPKNIELSIEEIKNILEEFEKMQGLKVLITGGEPLLHSNFTFFNRILPEYRFRKVLLTNGLLLTDLILKELNVQEIQFSVDGMKKGHEAIRGKGTFDKILAKIEKAIHLGFDVSIATIIHKENLDEFDEMEMLFKSIGIKDWTVDAPSLAGNLTQNEDILVSPEIAGKYLKYGFGGGLHGGDDGFACGSHLFSVLADGSLCKCAFYADNVVGKTKEGLRKNWQKIKPIQLNELECYALSCLYIDTCRGGCRFRAGNSNKKDLYKCYSYDHCLPK